MYEYFLEGGNLRKLNPEKLHVEFRRCVTETEPMIPRKYTLTHSDITAELFLTIGLGYALDKITSMRDEVLGEWVQSGNQYILNVYLHVDGHLGIADTAIRNAIFRKELPLALEAIVYGDNEFLKAHPELNNAPIIVYFNSKIQYYNVVENWGKVENYK